MVENIHPISQKNIKLETLPTDTPIHFEPLAGPSSQNTPLKPRKRNSTIKKKAGNVKRFIGQDIVNTNINIKEEEFDEQPKEKQDELHEHLQFIRDILPNADPTYLLSLCNQYGNNLDELSKKVSDLIQSRNYPTVEESTKTRELSLKNKQYTINFNIEAFLNIIPNPGDYFTKSVLRYTIDEKVINFIENLLFYICPSLEHERICAILIENNYNFFKSFQTIEKETDVICLDNNIVDCLYPGDNLQLLQEIAYCFHKDDIESFITKRDNELCMEILQATETNSMNTCQCCYSDDIIPRLTYFCENGCPFCRDCIIKSTEVVFGEGRLNFPCLAVCNGSINYQTLQFALPSKLYTKIIQKKAIADVCAAKIDGLEMCPFCDFALIPFDDDKVFKCLNPECMKESCLLCKELSHLPLKCHENEKNKDTQARTFIENRMTEALLRECYQCQVKFYKTDGCNMMTCTCGAKMCYICKKPVDDYNHYSNKRIVKNKCPLYSNTDKLHKVEVLNMYKRAKEEIIANLKNEPTKDLEKIFK